MSRRVTKLMIENQFVGLCNALGKRIATSWDDEGAYQLDYEAINGGWCIQENMGKGRISYPFGHDRYKASEFFDLLRFAQRTIAIFRDDNGACYWPKSRIENERPDMGE